MPVLKRPTLTDKKKKQISSWIKQHTITLFDELNTLPLYGFSLFINRDRKLVHYGEFLTTNSVESEKKKWEYIYNRLEDSFTIVAK